MNKAVGIISIIALSISTIAALLSIASIFSTQSNKKYFNSDLS